MPRASGPSQKHTSSQMWGLLAHQTAAGQSTRDHDRRKKPPMLGGTGRVMTVRGHWVDRAPRSTYSQPPYALSPPSKSRRNGAAPKPAVNQADMPAAGGAAAKHRGGRHGPYFLDDGHLGTGRSAVGAAMPPRPPTSTAPGIARANDSSNIHAIIASNAKASLAPEPKKRKKRVFYKNGHHKLHSRESAMGEINPSGSDHYIVHHPPLGGTAAEVAEANKSVSLNHHRQVRINDDHIWELVQSNAAAATAAEPRQHGNIHAHYHNQDHGDPMSGEMQGTAR